MKKLVSALLSLVMLLSLAACGDGSRSPAREDSSSPVSQDTDDQELVYVPTSYEVDLEGSALREVYGSVAAKGGVYLAVSMLQPSPEGPKLRKNALLHVDPDTGAIREVKLVPEGVPADALVSVEGVYPGENGALLVLLRSRSSGSMSTWLCALDAQEKVVSTVDLTSLGLEPTSTPRLAPSADGCLWLSDREDLIMYDKELRQKLRIPKAGACILLSSGAAGFLEMDLKTEISRMVAPDPKDGTLREICTLEQQLLGPPLPGMGPYLFLYICGDSLYGWDQEAGAAERIFRWNDLDLDKSDVVAVDDLEDGRLVVTTYDQWDPTSSPQVTVLTQTPRSQLPPRTELTLAALRVTPQLSEAVRDFNRRSTDVHINIRDYSELDLTHDRTAGMTKLMTELASGAVPDLLVCDGLPIEDFCRQELLVDIWPYIDGDKELRRSDLMLRPLEAASIDGMLPQVFPSFSIETAAASRALVGDRMGWTIDEAQALVSGLPQGVTLCDPGVTRPLMLSTLMDMHMDELVDWDTGACHFDTPEFRQLLAFSQSFSAQTPTDQEWISPYDLALAGKTRLLPTSLTSLKEMQLFRFVFGGEFSFVGWPSLDGRTGSAFRAYDGVAMTTACRDTQAAWDFLRTLLLDPRSEYPNTSRSSISKAAFDRAFAEEMVQEYETNLDGSPVLDQNGQKIPISRAGTFLGGNEVQLFAAAREDLERYMALYEATDRLLTADSGLASIVQTAEPYFCGDKSLEETARLIQGKMSIYVSEKR